MRENAGPSFFGGLGPKVDPRFADCGPRSVEICKISGEFSILCDVSPWPEPGGRLDAQVSEGPLFCHRSEVPDLFVDASSSWSGFVTLEQLLP